MTCDPLVSFLSSTSLIAVKKNLNSCLIIRETDKDTLELNTHKEQLLEVNKLTATMSNVSTSLYRSITHPITNCLMFQITNLMK